ncbi:helix-turn-helix transcriptional regulator [candidate division KSB1 bacterium]|nr:helix-turn-helix transcriptional regulator [candidate division KSB1 bacterium]
MSKIGSRIKEARKKAGFSQETLADKIHVNRSYLSLVENGKSSPTFEFLDKVASGLSLQVEDLVLGQQISDFVLTHPSEAPMYEGLRDFMQDREQMLLMNPSDEEINILRAIRVDKRFRPSKRFFIDALLDYRKGRIGR